MNDFDSLWRANRDSFLRTAAHYMRNLDDAEDVLQEAYLRGLAHFDQLESPEAFPHWCRRIIYRRCIDVKRFRQPDLQIFEDTQVSDNNGFTLQLELSTEVVEIIERAKSILSRPLFDVFNLCVIDDVDYADTAELIGIPIGTVRSRLYTARQLLKQSLLLVA